VRSLHLQSPRTVPAPALCISWWAAGCSITSAASANQHINAVSPTITSLLLHLLATTALLDFSPTHAATPPSSI
jgi:hypothetical protein